MRALGCEETDTPAAVFLAEESLEVSGGLLVGLGELVSPFHKETVGQPTHEGKDEHDIGMADPRAIVVVGDVQPLVKAALDAPSLAIEFKPASGGQFCDVQTGDERNLLRLVPLDVTAQAGDLCSEGKADLLGARGSRAQGTLFPTALVGLNRPRLGGRRMFRGGNPLRER